MLNVADFKCAEAKKINVVATRFSIAATRFSIAASQIGNEPTRFAAELT